MTSPSRSSVPLKHKPQVSRPSRKKRRGGRLPAKLPLFDVREDPLGALIVALPPAVATLGFIFPRFPLDPVAVPGFALVFIAMADAPRWRLSRLFWSIASVFLWPITLSGYLYARRTKGAHTAWWLGPIATVLHIWIYWQTFLATGRI